MIDIAEKTIEANAIKNCDKMTIHIDSHLSMNEDTPKEHKLNIRAVSYKNLSTNLCILSLYYINFSNNTS